MTKDQKYESEKKKLIERALSSEQYEIERRLHRLIFSPSAFEKDVYKLRNLKFKGGLNGSNNQKNR